ncbi:hypothetical protein NXH76_04175 [Blautia schinkii]|nr:hypothetical protein [Blautia schinkii]
MKENIEVDKEMCDIEKQKLKTEIIKCLEAAGKDLYSFDKDLINDNGVIDRHAHERSICFRFGLYFHKYIDSNKFLKGYDLDAEYNRDIEGIKRLDYRPNGCYPDLILHKRGSNESNILIIECKGWWAGKKDIDDDIDKIKGFLQSDRYKYMLGLLIIFNKEKIAFNWIE